MNLRILKKLSKRAAPLLAQLGDEREAFRAKRDENYTHSFIGARKHWERSSCHPGYEGRNNWSLPGGADRVFKTRAGRTIVMRAPSHPRKGTIMVGAVSGYYEPEWDEETAWDALKNIVYGHFEDYDPQTEELVPTRYFHAPADFFRGANDIIAAARR